MRCSTLQPSLAGMQEKRPQAPKQIACSTREPGVGVRERSLQEDWEDSNRCCKYFCRAERALSTGSDLLCCSPVKGDTRAQGQLLRGAFSTLRVLLWTQ